MAFSNHQIARRRSRTLSGMMKRKYSSVRLFIVVVSFCENSHSCGSLWLDEWNEVFNNDVRQHTVGEMMNGMLDECHDKPNASNTD
jgi:hypothetical protein